MPGAAVVSDSEPHATRTDFCSTASRQVVEEQHTEDAAGAALCAQYIRGLRNIAATIRLQTGKTKGCGSWVATLTMVFKLAQPAHARWRRLNGHALLSEVIACIAFKDGEKQAV